jgi:hypothetical protein
VTLAQLRPSTWWLPVVGFNLVPIAGVLWLGWDLGLILLLYWAENGLVGLSNLPKILAARGSVVRELAARIAARGGAPVSAGPSAAPSFAVPEIPPIGGVLMRLGTAAFFAFHYGMFWVVHGVFVFLIASGSFFGDEPFAGLSRGLPGSFWLALLGLVVLRLVDLGRWFGDREYEPISPTRQASEPYRRVIVLHLAIVLGGVLVATLGEPLLLLVVLVAVKIVIELGLERRAATRP